MVILIDGYNLLKQIFHKEKGSLKKRRDELIKQLGYYKRKKLKDIKEIILVFDGGLERRSSREIKSGIVVIFSGQRISADEWILRHAEKNREKELLLVSNDRELKSDCKKYGVDFVEVSDFYSIVQNSILDDVTSNLEKSNSNVINKYDNFMHSYNEQLKDFDDDENVALDMLMQSADLDKDLSYKNDYVSDRKCIAKRKKVSRKDKRAYKKIKKL